jgi:hypothetical protein
MEYVFIVTYGRSGSTLIQGLLNAIDGYCIRGENRAMVNHLSRAASAMVNLGQEITRANNAPDTPWYGVTSAQPEAFAGRMAEGFVSDILAPPEGTRVTGFKEIRYTPEHMSDEEYEAAITFMADMFADSRFIFNTREAAQVARSGWWASDERYTPADVKRIVQACDERFERSPDARVSPA